MTPRASDSPMSSGAVPVDDPKVAHYTEHTGPRIPPNFRAILRELGRYADSETGVAGPSQLVIADSLDMHRTTVSSGLNELEHLGFLTSRAKPGTGGKQVEWAFTAAATGWHPEPKGEVEKGLLLRAYRRLVEESRKQRDDDKRTIANLEARVAQLEGSTSVHRSPGTTEDRTFDQPSGGDGKGTDDAAPVAVPVIQERDRVNVGRRTDIDPPGKSGPPAAAGEEPDPESRHPGDSDDNQDMERDPDQDEGLEPVREFNAGRDAQVEPLESNKEQLAFTYPTDAPSYEHGRDIPAGGPASDDGNPERDR